MTLATLYLTTPDIIEVKNFYRQIFNIVYGWVGFLNIISYLPTHFARRGKILKQVLTCLVSRQILDQINFMNQKKKLKFQMTGTSTFLQHLKETKTKRRHFQRHVSKVHLELSKPIFSKSIKEDKLNRFSNHFSNIFGFFQHFWVMCFHVRNDRRLMHFLQHLKRQETFSFLTCKEEEKI